jgi:ADP-ribose pyrophosphatase
MNLQLMHTGRKIKVFVEHSTAADGTPVTRDLIEHPGAVAILPVVDADHVCLVRNRRPNVGKSLWEIPAGTLEPGEPPDQAAARELAEETGYRAAAWRKLSAFYPSPGVMSERTHLFVASDLTPGEMHLEKDEDLKPDVLPWTQVVQWALDGTIEDAKSLVAILLWDRLRGHDAAFCFTRAH